MERFHHTKTTLPNGLRVITVPVKGSAAVTALFLVEAGSKYESKDISGISHFLEHMCFKGTARRPSPVMVSRELDGLGAEYNAFTAHEYTGYYAKARAEDFEKIFDVLSDIYLNSALLPEEIEKERGVIIEEINMNEDSPQRNVHELFSRLLYGDQPAGWPIAGRKEVVLRLTQNDFREYRNAHYVPNATVVVIAGSFNEKRAMTLIKKAFGDVPHSAKGTMAKISEHQLAPQVSVQYKKTDQAHMVLGLRAFGAQDPRRHALKVLANILGGWMSSRLFQEVRVRLGAAYYIHAYPELYADHGALAIAAGVSLTKVHEAIEAIVKELSKLRKHAVSAEELALAKSNVIGSTAISLETSDDLASFYGSQEIAYRRILSVDTLVESLTRVSARDIQAVANDIITNKRLNLALIGPYKDAAPFKRSLRLPS
jgi:predicted Zn-dependent peptidase